MKALDLLYNKHLETKTRWMIGQLDGIGLAHLCDKIIPSPIRDGFRNRAKFRIFYDKSKSRIEGTDPIEGPVALEKSLWILPDWGKQLVREITVLIQKDSQDSCIDGLEIQLAHGKRNAHVTFSVKRSLERSCEGLAMVLLKSLPEIVGVAIPSKKLEYGESYLDHSINEKIFCAHHASFFQSNLHLTPKLLEYVVGVIRGVSFREIMDLYCGVGLISLSVGNESTKISGVDTNRLAVRSAQRNAGRMGFVSPKFSVSSVERYIQTAEISAESFVLINPPRSGCPSSVINAIASKIPNYVLLVSCSLKTHVIDLAEWQKGGYGVLSLTAFDMFPFTEFLETVTLLKRNG
jgi:tRNA/tmRNA/rRNA uracil-C5-methylase (TrmA/RlmC/RlmD family)